MNNGYLLTLAEKHGIDLIGFVDMGQLELFRYRILTNDINDLAFFDGKLSDRLDYKNVWNECEGIISFGMGYYSAVNNPDDDILRGIISTASYGEDYHNVLKRKAEALMDEFTKEFPVEYKIFVDTGTLSDRALAYCAGLGFYGNNNFIINETYGSYIFLGHILINKCADVSVRPLESKCGGCSICANACPNGCYGEKMLEYDRCISYLTQKGISADTKGYLYGCDICQQACPYNKGIPERLHEEFIASSEFAYPAIDYILNMQKEEFSQVYGNSALAWRRLGNLKKNAENVKKRRKP
ncbi:MAG: tRNA epoxyqueuosine(34) reductase QueG [Anaerofustis stercorihominis]|nr:tRNA epoxyqueuosine(34) reductase QueG [Anaerofustis stercorihominis]